MGYKDIPVRIHSFDNELEEKKFVVIANLERRQLNNFQKVELYSKLYQYNTELEARTRQISNLNNRTNDGESVSRDIDSFALSASNNIYNIAGHFKELDPIVIGGSLVFHLIYGVLTGFISGGTADIGVFTKVKK